MAEDPQVRAAHISGKYLIAATIIGGIFAAGLTIVITLNFSQSNKIEYLDRYEKTVTVPICQLTISKGSIQIANPDVLKVVNKNSRNNKSRIGYYPEKDDFYYVDYKFDEAGISIRLILLSLNPWDTEILAMTRDGSKKFSLLNFGDIWKVSNDYSLIIDRGWLGDDECARFSLRLFEQKKSSS